MRITNLPTSSSFASNDVLAIEVNGVTYKLTGATLAAAVKSIGDYVTSDDVVTTTTDGLMLSSDKVKLNGIAAGAQVNTITGVKGGAESSYRTGNVNLTPTNVGALAAANVYNGLDKTGSGYALDARQGKALKDTQTIIGNGAFNLGSVAANSSKDLKSTQSAHAMLILTGPSVNLFGLYLIRISTSGTPNTVTVTQGSSITFTPASGKITIGNTSTSSIVVNVIPLSGDSSQFSLT